MSAPCWVAQGARRWVYDGLVPPYREMSLPQPWGALGVEGQQLEATEPLSPGFQSHLILTETNVLPHSAQPLQ